MKKSCSKELELLALIGRRDRLTHSELCKKVKDDVTSLLKPWVNEISSTLKDSVS
jgi:hypothetical protein